MTEPHWHNVEWKKPDTIECIPFIWNLGAGKTNLWLWLPLRDDY